MGDLIRLGFSVEWTTDHQQLLAERVGMGLITKGTESGMPRLVG